MNEGEKNLLLAVVIGVVITCVACLFPWKNRKVPWSVALLGAIAAALAGHYLIRQAFENGVLREPTSGVENAVASATFFSSCFGLFAGLLVVMLFRIPYWRRQWSEF